MNANTEYDDTPWTTVTGAAVERCADDDETGARDDTLDLETAARIAMAWMPGEV